MAAVGSFAVVYRFVVAADDEAAFIEAWHALTLILRERCGGFGSRLHRADDGDFIAYARWPSRAVREAANPEGDDVDRWRAQMKKTATLIRTEAVLEVVDDLLLDM